MDKEMSIERAMQILDPEHRENYGRLQAVNTVDVWACAGCGSGEYLLNEDGNRNRFCGQCGQAIDWSEDNG